MGARQWIGMTAVVQAVGVASLPAIVKAPWLLVSALIGVTGIILLISFARSNRYDSTIAPNGDANPAHGSDYAGSQARDLLERIGDMDVHHD